MRVSDRASPGRFPPSFPSIVTSTCGEAHAEVGAADVRCGRPGHTVGRARAPHRRGVLSLAFAARASVRRAPQVGRLGPATTRPRRTPRDPLPLLLLLSPAARGALLSRLEVPFAPRLVIPPPGHAPLQVPRPGRAPHLAPLRVRPVPLSAPLVHERTRPHLMIPRV